MGELDLSFSNNSEKPGVIVKDYDRLQFAKIAAFLSEGINKTGTTLISRELPVLVTNSIVHAEWIY